MAQVLTRRTLLKAAAAAPVLGAGTAAGAAPLRRGGTLRIAEIGEPLTLDTVATTADLTTNITMPVFEELFALDAVGRVQPMLVSSYTLSRTASPTPSRSAATCRSITARHSRPMTWSRRSTGGAP